MAICKLCQRTAELQKSHLLPASLYKRARDRSGRNPHPLCFSAKGERQTSRQGAKPLLCLGCEQRFHSRGENWTMRHAATLSAFRLREELLSHERAAHRLTDDLCYFRTVDLPSIDADALGYFALSVIWRAAVCDWEIDGESIPQLQLGPYSEALRTYLLGEADLPADLTVDLCVCSAAEVHIMTTMPQTKNWGAYRSHFFDIPGLSFMVNVGARIPKKVREMCLFRGSGRPLFYTAVAQIANARDYVKLSEYRAKWL